jgi:hypothetical protein
MFLKIIIQDQKQHSVEKKWLLNMNYNFIFFHSNKSWVLKR